MVARRLHTMSISEFLESYSLDATEFHLFLSDWGGFVAGSSALHLYLKQINSTISFEPGDIDIWFPYSELYSWNLEEIATEFFRIYGYDHIHSSIDSIPDEVCDEYQSVIHTIQNVITFQNADGKRIQCIFIYEDKFSEKPQEFLIAHFDLSICATWWDPRTLILKTFHPIFTERGQMFALQQTPPQKRIDKYKTRGFSWIEHFPHPVRRMDYRSFTSSKHASYPVLDLLDYSEYTLKEYLQQSPENIVIKAGECMYAFTRKFLRTYMIEKRELVQVKGIWEWIQVSPLHQSLLAFHANLLDHGDYSIYELKPYITIKKNDIPYTICSLHCYSVRSWEQGLPCTGVYP